MGDLVSVGLGALGIESPSEKAAKRAVSAQQTGIDQATAEQQRQFDITQQQSQPFRDAELAALQQREPLREEATRLQAALSGLGGIGAQQQAFDQFNASPGQEFLRNRGQQALLRNSAAIGGLGGGNVQSALQQQGIGFAQQDLQNQLARISGFTGAQEGGSTNLLANQRSNLATNIGNLGIQGGQVQAGGILDANQANQNFAGDIGSVLSGGLGGFVSPKSNFSQGATAGLLGLF